MFNKKVGAWASMIIKIKGEDAFIGLTNIIKFLKLCCFVFTDYQVV